MDLPWPSVALDRWTRKVLQVITVLLIRAMNDSRVSNADQPCEQRPLVLVSVVPSLSVTSAAHGVEAVRVMDASWRRQLLLVDDSIHTVDCLMHRMEDAVVTSRSLTFLELRDSVELVSAEWWVH